MEKEIEYTPEAIDDLQGIKEYISNKLNNSQTAQRIVDNIIDSIETLVDMPEIGALLSSRIETDKDLRYLVSGNYNVIYRVEAQIVKILRVINARRDFTRLF